MARPKTIRKTASTAKLTAQQATCSTKSAHDPKAPQPVDRTTPSMPVRPGGKLGVIIDRLAADVGATADELVETTGWQKHTVFGALSRLRTRGFAMRLEAMGNRRAYRLERSEA